MTDGGSPMWARQMVIIRLPSAPSMTRLQIRLLLAETFAHDGWYRWLGRVEVRGPAGRGVGCGGGEYDFSGRMLDDYDALTIEVTIPGKAEQIDGTWTLERASEPERSDRRTVCVGARAAATEGAMAVEPREPPSDLIKHEPMLVQAGPAVGNLADTVLGSRRGCGRWVKRVGQGILLIGAEDVDRRLAVEGLQTVNPSDVGTTAGVLATAFALPTEPQRSLLIVDENNRVRARHEATDDRTWPPYSGVESPDGRTLYVPAALRRIVAVSSDGDLRWVVQTDAPTHELAWDANEEGLWTWDGTRLRGWAAATGAPLNGEPFASFEERPPVSAGERRAVDARQRRYAWSQGIGLWPSPLSTVHRRSASGEQRGWFVEDDLTDARLALMPDGRVLVGGVRGWLIGPDGVGDLGPIALPARPGFDRTADRWRVWTVDPGGPDWIEVDS